MWRSNTTGVWFQTASCILMTMPCGNCGRLQAMGCASLAMFFTPEGYTLGEHHGYGGQSTLT